MQYTVFYEHLLPSAHNHAYNKCAYLPDVKSHGSFSTSKAGNLNEPLKGGCVHPEQGYTYHMGVLN